jgi:hypothetical protein
MVVSHSHSYLCELVVNGLQDFCWQYHLGIFWNSCSWPFSSKEDFFIFPLLTILTRDRILNVLDWVATQHTIPHSHIPWHIFRRDKVVHILDYWNMASLHWRNYLVFAPNAAKQVFWSFVYFCLHFIFFLICLPLFMNHVSLTTFIVSMEQLKRV